MPLIARMMVPTDVICAIAVLPPPPGWVVRPRAVPGVTITTLPTEAVADAAAASTAAVDRSPATAANDAWNALSSKLATACWISKAASWSTLDQAMAPCAMPAAIAERKRGVVSRAI